MYVNKEGLKMFDLPDIKRVQAQRPDLDEDSACEVLGFLNDVYSVESFDVSDTDKLFKDTANYIYPREQA